MVESVIETVAPDARSSRGDSPVVIARGLTKTFKDFWMRDRARAVASVDFDIYPGEVFGLLGPNGSGKSTTIKMILGLLKKSSGRLAVFGRSPSDVAIKKRIGYLPEESYLYPYLNARETLEYYGKLFQQERVVRQRRIDELLDMVGLGAVQHRQVHEYSKGMARRLGLAQALINDPEFLILDEPTTGLDPIGTRQVKDLIAYLGGRGKTILLSSHQLSDVEDVVDRMVVLYGGQIRAAGTCDDLLASRTRSVIETSALDEETVSAVKRTLEERSHSVERVRPARQRLEELFVELVEKARAEQASNAGAGHGGNTASFLGGEGAARDAAVGAALIENLVSNQSAEPVQEAMVEDAATPEDDEVSSVVTSLLGGDADADAGQASAEGDDRTPSGESEVDSSVIDDLLGGDKSGAGS